MFQVQQQCRAQINKITYRAGCNVSSEQSIYWRWGGSSFQLIETICKFRLDLADLSEKRKKVLKSQKFSFVLQEKMFQLPQNSVLL